MADKETQIDDDIEIYRWPEKEKRESTTQDGAEEIIQGAEDFIDSGSSNTLDIGKFQDTFSNIYNTFFQIGVGASVIVGIVLGIKFMLAGVEEKAEVKKMLMVYVIACVVVFGSFGIWKLAIEFLNKI